MRCCGVFLLAVMVVAPGMATAQNRSASVPPPASTNGAAGTAMRLKTLHYKDVHGLRRGPDGQWTGKARQNGVEKSVTITPQGTVIAR